MPYRCEACGCKTRRASATGACPACHSMSLKAIGEQTVVKPTKSPKTKVEIFIMVLLWSLLIYGVYDKYLRHWLE